MKNKLSIALNSIERRNQELYTTAQQIELMEAQQLYDNLMFIRAFIYRHTRTHICSPIVRITYGSLTAAVTPHLVSFFPR